MAAHPNPERRQSFDEDAEAYDLGRPGYPAALYDHLCSTCGLAAGTRVLEIGCGTGQATRDLLARGAHVTAVELGSHLAEQASRNFAGRAFEVRTGAFEDERLDAGSFELAVSATAFHWVDADVALPRIADALVEDGRLALWWTIFGDADRPDPFQDAAQPIFEQWQPPADSHAGVGDALGWFGHTAESVTRSGRFGPVEHRRFAWEGRHRADELRRLFSTYSPVRTLPEPDRTHLLDALEALVHDRFDGTVTRPYLTVLYTAPRL